MIFLAQPVILPIKEQCHTQPWVFPAPMPDLTLSQLPQELGALGILGMILFYKFFLVIFICTFFSFY